jgi:hypothetical protein
MSKFIYILFLNLRYWSAVAVFAILLSKFMKYSDDTINILVCCHSWYTDMLSHFTCWYAATIFILMLICCHTLHSVTAYTVLLSVTVYIMFIFPSLYTIMLSVLQLNVVQMNVVAPLMNVKRPSISMVLHIRDFRLEILQTFFLLL